MSDETPPPPSHPFAAFVSASYPFLRAGNPFLRAFSVDAWHRGVADQIARVQAVTDEAVRVEAQGVAHTRTLIDESAKLAHATVSFAAQLSAEWRKVMFEVARKSLDLVVPGVR